MRGLGAEAKYVNMGNGAGVSAKTDTDVFVPSSEARVNGTSSSVTTTVANDTHQVTALITADSAKTYTNVGVWDAVTGGTLTAKSDFAGQALNLNDAISWTLKTTLS